jgi:hypothetical protein
MTVMQQLGARHTAIEEASRRGQFLSVCKFLMLGKGQVALAARLAEEQRASPLVIDVLKAAVNPQTLSSLQDFRLMVDAFVSGLSSFGLFDAALPFMVRVPLSSTVGAVSTIATGYVVGEGSAKQISRLSLTNGTLEPLKAHAVVVVANELLKLAGPGSLSLLQRELSNAAVLAVDTSFVGTLLSGVSVGTSSGSTAESVRSDIAGLLSLVSGDATSRWFIATTPLVVRMWAMMGSTSTNATPPFPDLTVSGGEISGIRVIASDAVTTAGQVILFDAGSIASNSGDVELSVLSEGSVFADSAPDSPSAGSIATSLWQLNLSALRAERWHASEKLRASSVAALTNSNSYVTGFSPP